VPTVAALDDAHISELHALAGELELPEFRKLRRGELIEAIREAGGERVEESAERQARSDRERASRRREGSRRGGGRDSERRSRDRRGERRDRQRDRDEEIEAEEPGVDAEPVVGVLDVLPQRYGFLRLSGLESADGDVYISASQIRRCELRPGDEVAGPARDPRRGERHRALVHVDKVNGEEPSDDGRIAFEDLTPVPPSRRIPVGGGGEGDARILVRAADLLVPLAYGQRVLVDSAPGSGRTTLLRGLASALLDAEGPELIVLLVDERPEEATRWRRALPDARLAIATAEMSGAEQAQVADLALSRAKRLAESGKDAVLIADSLSRLAAARGRVDAAKAFFGAGRETEEENAGSLTVVATVLGDDEVAQAVATTESARISLDAELAAGGIYPAIDVRGSRVAGEAELRESAELDAARRLRSLLSDLQPRDAAAMLRERIETTPSNEELLGAV
jgi:transcription termination factor Rho